MQNSKRSKMYVLYGISLPVVVLKNVIIALLIKNVFDMLSNTEQTTSDVLNLGIVILVSILIITLFTIVSEYSRNSLIQFKLQKIRDQIILNSFMNKNMNQNQKGDNVNQITTDCKFIEQNYYIPVFDLIENVLTFVATAIVILSINITILVLIIFLVFPILIIPKIFSKTNNRASKKASNTFREFLDNYDDAFSGKSVIEEYEKQSVFIEKIRNYLNISTHSMIHYQLFKSISSVTIWFFALVSFFAIQLYAVYLCINGNITLGETLAVIQLSNSILNPITAIIDGINSIASVKEIHKKLVRKVVLDKQQKLDDCPEIHVNNVSFAYGDKQVLKNIDFSIEANEKILLVGKNGCGKSTLCRIISGHIEGFEGLINQKNIFYKNEHAIYVDQKGYLFNTTIQENITLGDYFEQEELDRVIVMSDLEALIHQKGYDYICAKNGDALSGGEKQKIQIARALIRNKKILILDESFSAMDEDSRNKVESNILKIADLTVLCISHQSTRALDQYITKTVVLSKD